MKQQKSKGTKRLLVLLLVSIIALAGTATSHADIVYDTTFYEVGNNNYQSISYSGSGWVTVNTTNNSGSDWGDFHFFLTGADPSVFFVGDPTWAETPTSSQLISWVPQDNSSQVIDLYYYGDPLYIGQTGTFAVHIENPNLDTFTVNFYPTPLPVPEASTMFLLACQLIGIALFNIYRRNHQTMSINKRLVSSH